MHVQPIALIVNAGGGSRRMGRTKALLPVPPFETPLIIHIIRQLLPLVTDNIAVVCNDPSVEQVAGQIPGVQLLRDRWLAHGPLGGITTGLALCQEWAMVVACDMPSVDPSVFTRLIEESKKQPLADAIIPRIDGQAQPLHGLWHRRAIPLLESQLASSELSVMAALEKLSVVWLDQETLGVGSDSMAFYNVNTPEEWAEWLQWWQAKNKPVA